ncbi:hypothetical protein P4O66_013521, partial [Electrophorus voltai]
PKEGRPGTVITRRSGEQSRRGRRTLVWKPASASLCASPKSVCQWGNASGQLLPPVCPPACSPDTALGNEDPLPPSTMATMKPSMDLDEEEELGLYQKKLRERANRSIQQLSSMLANHSSDAEALEQGSSPSCQSEGPWPSVQQSEAVSQLRSLLQQRPREAQVQSLSPSKRKSSPKRHTDEDSSSLPAVQDLVPIIHNQSEYIQHLEAEVKFCKEELLVMKQRVRVVVVENEKLHEELKAKMVEDTLKEYTLVDSTVNEETTVDKITSTPKPRQSFIHQNEDKWKKELEQLKCLYQAQTETLEAQVVSLKKDLVSCQKECEEVKQRLRHKEAVAAMVGSGQRVGGLCVKCAQHEAVLAETHSNVHVQAIERLTKERDELMTVLCSLRAAQSEAQQREWSAYQQVKQAVEMSEEANLEKTKARALPFQQAALVQCEHIQAELARQRERLEKTLASEQEKISQARTIAQAEGKREKEKLAQAVSSLTQRVAELEGLVGRGERERNSLNTQLEEAFRKLTSQEADSSKVCGELRYQLSQAQLKREEAEREARDSSAKLGRRLELTEQEVQKLGAELSGSRQRLEEAQRAEGRARAEAAGLAEGLSRAQRQLHLTRGYYGMFKSHSRAWAEERVSASPALTQAGRANGCGSASDPPCHDARGRVRRAGRRSWGRGRPQLPVLRLRPLQPAARRRRKAVAICALHPRCLRLRSDPARVSAPNTWPASARSEARSFPIPPCARLSAAAKARRVAASVGPGDVLGPVPLEVARVLPVASEAELHSCRGGTASAHQREEAEYYGTALSLTSTQPRSPIGPLGAAPYQADPPDPVPPADPSTLGLAHIITASEQTRAGTLADPEQGERARDPVEEVGLPAPPLVEQAGPLFKRSRGPPLSPALALSLTALAGGAPSHSRRQQACRDGHFSSYVPNPVQEKETAERRCAEDTAALTFQAQRRERELTQTLRQMEAQHEQSVAETDALLSSQKGLIGKLKEECRRLGSELEELTLANRRVALHVLQRHCMDLGLIFLWLYPQLKQARTPVRDLSLYAGTRQPVPCPGSARRPSHAPLTSGLWGSQLLKQRRAHYSHRSLQSAAVSRPSLGRAEVEQLSLEKQHLQDSVEKLQGRCQEMEEQCVQHGRMHQRMKHRYAFAPCVCTVVSVKNFSVACQPLRRAAARMPCTGSVRWDMRGPAMQGSRGIWHIARVSTWAKEAAWAYPRQLQPELGLCREHNIRLLAA